jgi:GNAT superfamily N-acetyltransferase
MDPTSLGDAFGPDFELAIGPAFQGAFREDALVPHAASDVRELVPTDRDAVERFQSECGASDWASSGLGQADRWRHAYFDGDKITAMAGYRARGEEVGDPCILTHPTFRGCGRGAAVARAVVAVARSNGKLVLYQTLESNEASVRLALSLGYERYANHVAIRLKR